VIAYLMFGETLTAMQVAGMAVAAGGVGLASGPQTRSTR
jgi:drug/metabolite transporter (DMT)-like permease